MSILTALISFAADFFISIWKIEFIAFYFIAFVSVYSVVSIWKRLKD